MEATEISPGLWQGSAPTTAEDRVRVRKFFDVLVLMAEEFQPPASQFPGVEVLHGGIADQGKQLRRDEFETACRVANVVADRVRSGKRVLVTCLLGLNRSGLVTALALHNLTGASGERCARRVQLRRTGALFNPFFVERLRQIPSAEHTWH